MALTPVALLSAGYEVPEHAHGPNQTDLRNTGSLCLEKTTLRVRDYVQTVGLNADTKKDRHRAVGEIFVLTFPFIGVRPESRLNDCLAERIPTRPGLPWPVP